MDSDGTSPCHLEANMALIEGMKDGKPKLGCFLHSLSTMKRGNTAKRLWIFTMVSNMLSVLRKEGFR